MRENSTGISKRPAPSDGESQIESQTRQWLYRLLPGLLSLPLYWRAFGNWFLQDDFGSLQIAIQTNTWADAWRWLTHPLAQGVYRPIPDCLFYAGFYKLFGLNALPYKVAIFGVHLLNLALLNRIARGLAGARAGFLAALIYAANPGLIMGLSWTTVVSQILCAFFALAGIHLAIRYTQADDWRLYATQWITFLLGLATLEITVTYPALLIAYCWLYSRRHLVWFLPMLLVSCAYAVWSLSIPRPAGGPYTMYWDASMVAGLWHYWTVFTGAAGVAKLGFTAAATASGLVLVASLFWLLFSAKDHRPVFWGLFWFLVTLGPVLPLRDQRMDYYLILPAAGLALAIGAAAGRSLAALWPLAVYAACSIPVVIDGVDFWHERSLVSRRLIASLMEARKRYPTQAILLHGITPPVFYAALFDRGHAVVGLRRIYLWPGSPIPQRPGFPSIAPYEYPVLAARHAIHLNQAAVLEVNDRGELRNIAQPETLGMPSDGLPEWVDIDDPAFEQTAAEGGGWWIGPRAGMEALWMGQRAGVQLAAPRVPGRKLRIRAIYPGEGRAQPVNITVTVNGIRVGVASIRDVSTEEHVFALPDAVVGAKALTVTLDADRTFTIPPDQRPLSAAFGRIELI